MQTSRQNSNVIPPEREGLGQSSLQRLVQRIMTFKESKVALGTTALEP